MYRDVSLPAKLPPRFEEYHLCLRSLPRKVRRSLQRKWKRSLAGIALLLALGQAPALAATINVGGTCTLVRAIVAANNNTTASGNCRKGSGADTIVLPRNSTQRLTTVNNDDNGLPVIRSTITIAGNNSTIRRAQTAPEFRILEVGQTGNLTLTRLTLTGGSANSGGGVSNDGNTTINSSTISGNSAAFLGGGVSNGGNIAINSSTISGNFARETGGGVSNDGNTTINSSTISGNSAAFVGGGVSNGENIAINSSTISGNIALERGGGVAQYGSRLQAATLTINNSTISGNTAHEYQGGGIFIAYSYDAGSNRVTKTTISGNSARIGAGIELFGAAVTLVNSTVSGNSANIGGGVLFEGYNNHSRLTMTNSTISGNTGGGVVCRDGSGTITNSTITGNSGGGVVINFCEKVSTLARTIVSGNGPEISTRNGALTAVSFNLLGHKGLTNAQAFENFTPGPTDITATSDGNDPMALTEILDTELANNGGPTRTHALVGGSPAIDTVTDGTCPPPARDQRGVRRPQDGNGDGGQACNIGSFERRPGE
jgi:hypothetical protein